MKRLALLTLGALTACGTHSESVLDPSVGINGGFETVRSGLPVNWLLYTPKTVREGDFDIVIDTVEKVEGKQSLKFVVRKCSSEGGWLSPGFAQEIAALPRSAYTIGFWVKNSGAEVTIRAGGVTADNATYQTLLKTSGATGGWMHVTGNVMVPAGSSRLRLELSITRPGTFSIDDVVIVAK